jgi:opacity protein-like surface antigen
MKHLKLQISALFLVTACFLIPEHAAAQWNIGASYQVRHETPKKGFGVHIQRQVLKAIPVVYLGLRAHFSYFKSSYEQHPTDVPSQTTDIKFYDYGLDAIGGVPLGFLKPYVGIGIGSDKYKMNDNLVHSARSESKFFFNSFVGAALTFIPLLHPFIEYRFEPSGSPKFFKDFNSDGRLVLGLSLVF